MAEQFNAFRAFLGNIAEALRLPSVANFKGTLLLNLKLYLHENPINALILDLTFTKMI